MSTAQTATPRSSSGWSGVTTGGNLVCSLIALVLAVGIDTFLIPHAASPEPIAMIHVRRARIRRTSSGSDYSRYLPPDVTVRKTFRHGKPYVRACSIRSMRS